MKRKLLILFLLISILQLPRIYAETVTDSFEDESLVSSYENLYVNTSAGLVRLGPETAPGSYHYALDFNSDDDEVNFYHPDSLEKLEIWSIECWFYTKELDPQSVICSKRYNLQVRLKATGRIFAYVQTDGTNVQTQGLETTNEFQKYHLVVTFDNTTTREACIFLNGTEMIYEYQTAGTGTLNDDTNQDLYIGSHRSGSMFYNGTIDEFRIYNRVINQTEITYSYNNHEGRHTPLNQTGLVLWCHFNEGSGTDINDSSPENNDGDLIDPDSDEWVTGLVYEGEDYYETGILYSVNLLSGLNVSVISTLSYESNITGSELIEFQFSQDNATWYDSTDLDGWETLTHGNQTINLSNLGWRGGLFYYRASFTRGSTPELMSITLTWSEITEWEGMGFIGFVIACICLALFFLPRK